MTNGLEAPRARVFSAARVAVVLGCAIIAPRSFVSCRSKGDDPAPVVPADATPPPSSRTAATIAEVPSTPPPWAKGSVSDRLRALAVVDSDYAKPDLYSWTTRSQVEALRRDHRLLVARATDGPKSPFVWLTESLARTTTESGAIAKLLADDSRFVRRRYAWTASFATVLGLSAKRYGDELVHVRLRADTIVLRLDPSRRPPFAACDMEGHDVPLAAALASPDRIGAVLHVRKGTDVPAPFREYVIVNEEAIAAYGVGTRRVAAELEAERALLRDLVATTDVPSARTPRTARSRASTFDAPLLPSASLPATWDRALAFPISRYELDAVRLREIAAALDAARRTSPPIEYPVPGATDD